MYTSYDCYDRPFDGFAICNNCCYGRGDPQQARELPCRPSTTSSWTRKIPRFIFPLSPAPTASCRWTTTESSLYTAVEKTVLSVSGPVSFTATEQNLHLHHLFNKRDLHLLDGVSPELTAVEKVTTSQDSIHLGDGVEGIARRGRAVI